MYAVIETAGKQYRVELGTQLEVDRMDVEPGQSVQLERVLLVADGDETEIGRPTVAGAVVAADVVRQDRGEKIVVFKYRPKARHRAKQGHRQDLTVLRIADISWGGRSAAADAEARRTTERQAAEEAAREADLRAASDKALAAKLAAEADSESGTDAGAAIGARQAGSADRDTTARRTTITTKGKPSTPSTVSSAKATPRTPAARTQAPAPEKGVRQPRTTKKDG
jgi:large subunit ribosomal protein L21